MQLEGFLSVRQIDVIWKKITPGTWKQEHEADWLNTLWIPYTPFFGSYPQSAHFQSRTLQQACCCQTSGSLLPLCSDARKTCVLWKIGLRELSGPALFPSYYGTCSLKTAKYCCVLIWIGNSILLFSSSLYVPCLPHSICKQECPHILLSSFFAPSLPVLSKSYFLKEKAPHMLLFILLIDFYS